MTWRQEPKAVARPSDPANVSSAAHAEPVQPGSSGQVIPDQGISPVALMVDGSDRNGVWWEKDTEVEGPWWHYTPGQSWGRWKEQTVSWKQFEKFWWRKDLILGRMFLYPMRYCVVASFAIMLDEEGQQPRGWLNKCTALCHMFNNDEMGLLKKNLRRLSEHHSLRKPYERLDREYGQKGSNVYTSWI